MDLVCPKCNGVMRQYERNGVTIDQCGDCRGIFLDRGELERLSSAEAKWQGGGGGGYAGGGYAPPAPRDNYGRDRYTGRDNYGRERYGRSGYPQRGHHPRKKRSFFEGLFDD